MTIAKTVNGTDFVVSLSGRLDTNTAPQFEEFIVENSNQMGTLTLDCAGLEYLSSAGLRVLLSAQKRLKGAMKLKNVCELVMEVFEMTGFADILEIE
jgi:anti-sigma B factor antagonist